MLRNLFLIAAVFGMLVGVLVGVAACGGNTGDTTTPAASTPAPAPATSPAGTPTQAADDPAAEYASLCAGCHEADGSGGFGPDLRGEDNAGRVAEQVRSGGGSMPSFSGDLTGDQIDALAAWVVSEL